MSVLQQWQQAQADPQVPVNENFVALEHIAVYGKDATTTAGLIWGYLGGRWAGFAVAAGTVALAANSTLYVVVARATGVLSASTPTTNWNNTAAYARVYKLTTGVATVTAVEDWRSGTGGVHGAANAGGSSSLATLSDVSIGTPADGQVLVYSASLGKWIPGTGGGGSGGGGRELLTAARTYYVSPTGSDSANGLTAGTAFATLAKAEAVVTGTLDLGGFDVTIKLADGTYTAGVTLRRLTGSGTAFVDGTATVPGNVILDPASGSAIRVDGSGSDWLLRSFRVNAPGGSGLVARNGGWIRHYNMVFGACALSHISLEPSGRVTCSGAYAIAGASPIHIQQSNGSSYLHNGFAIAVNTPVNFSTAFFYSTGGNGIFKNYTLTGSAVSGKRYTLEALAMLDAGGTSASFPGSTAGTVASGAQII